MTTPKPTQEIVLELQANEDGSVSFVAVAAEAPAAKPEADTGCAGRPIPQTPERLELTAEREIVLRCGEASLTLTRAGKIILRGTYVLSRSSGVNKIKGGSVQIN